MPSIEEIEAWTVPEILREIERLLPPGARLHEEPGETGWTLLAIRQPSTKPDAPAETLWQTDGPDRRLLLLNAFGWLWTRDHKPKNPAWRPHPGGTRPYRRPAYFPKTPDRPDHDPANIRAVYAEKTKRK